MVNHGQTRTGFAYARLGGFIACALGFLISSAISEASPWTANGEKSSSSRPGYAAHVPQIDFVPRNDSEAIAFLAADNVRRKQNIEAALKNSAEALSRPNVGLISSDEVSGYPYVDRYLSEQLGDKDITHYYILREDYKFEDLSGGSITIPAGFIWDGASLPKVRGAIALEVGNTRYNSALGEGLIHDFMYRDPRRFSKEEADDLFYVNLMRCRNANPIAIYEAVKVAGGDSYQGHKKRQDQGLYDVFTPKFYAENLKMFQGVKDSSLQKKQADMNSSNRNSPSDDWDCCKCANPEDRDFYCTKCGKISRGFAPHVDKEFEQMLKRRK